MLHTEIKQLQQLEPRNIQQMVPEMLQVEELLYQSIGTDQGIIREICTYLLKNGGKKLRPLLIVLCGKAIKSNDKNHYSEKLIAAGTAVELIHMASLVHDDIIDKSLYRRGQPSVHSLWGQKNAVLVGDFLFAKAFDLLVSHQLFSVLQLMVKAIQEMCRGEIIQSTSLYQTDQNEEDYFQRIDQKTGKLLAACCQAGTIIAKANLSEETALKNYGTYLGYTYQIVDDLLDFTGNIAVLGKPVCQDLAQGNLTLPILYLIKHPEKGPWVKKVISQKELNPANLKLIMDLLNDHDLLTQSQKVANYCGDQAKKSLLELPTGIYRTMLEILIDKALQRTS